MPVPTPARVYRRDIQRSKFKLRNADHVDALRLFVYTSQTVRRRLSAARTRRVMMTLTWFAFNSR